MPKFIYLNYVLSLDIDNLSTFVVNVSTSGVLTMRIWVKLSYGQKKKVN